MTPVRTDDDDCRPATAAELIGLAVMIAVAWGAMIPVFLLIENFYGF